MMSRRGAAIVFATAAVVFAACSSGGASSAPSSGASAAPTSVAPSTAPSAAAVEIDWYHIQNNDPGLSLWQALADEYMAAHPNVKINVNVNENEVLTIRVLADDRAYWRNAKEPWARSDVQKLTDVFKLYKNDPKKIVIIQIDRESKFDNMVHIIDELDLAGLSRFSLGTLDEQQKKEVESL